MAYTQAELNEAQATFGLRFPPDLIALLLKHRLAQGYDWTRDHAAIREAVAAPLDGLVFDVEQNGLWWPEWGARPVTPGARQDRLREVVAAAPRLIPLVGHRYIPETPQEAGNPVFSVMQSDVIEYGADLDHYIQREFFDRHARAPMPAKVIPFWSELVLRAGENTRPA